MVIAGPLSNSFLINAFPIGLWEKSICIFQCEDLAYALTHNSQEYCNCPFLVMFGLTLLLLQYSSWLMPKLKLIDAYSLLIRNGIRASLKYCRSKVGDSLACMWFHSCRCSFSLWQKMSHNAFLNRKRLLMPYIRYILLSRLGKTSQLAFNPHNSSRSLVLYLLRTFSDLWDGDFWIRHRYSLS